MGECCLGEEGGVVVEYVLLGQGGGEERSVECGEEDMAWDLEDGRMREREYVERVVWRFV